MTQPGAQDRVIMKAMWYRVAPKIVHNNERNHSHEIRLSLTL